MLRWISQVTFSVVLLGLLSSFAVAAPISGGAFEIIKNGQKFLCSPEAIDSGATLDCVNKAYAGPFSQADATSLCAGAQSVAPADCALAAYAGPFSIADSLHLCTGAIDTGPAECAKAAYAGPFSMPDALLLCSVTGELANAQCAIRAYAGIYTAQQAIQMCKASPILVSSALSELQNEKAVGYGAILAKALRKAGK